jgi:Tfp pilus assembly protein PilP
MNQTSVLLLGALLTITVYAAENASHIVRDPFALPTASSAGVHAFGNLDHYPINSLKLVGVIVQPDSAIARVRDPNQREYWLRVGQVVGSERATVSQIAADGVRLQWQLDGQPMIAMLTLEGEMR